MVSTMTNETTGESSQYPADLATLAPQTWREWRDRLPENREDEKLAALLRFAIRTDFAQMPEGYGSDDWEPDPNNANLLDTLNDTLRHVLNAELGTDNEGEARQPWRRWHWENVV